MRPSRRLISLVHRTFKHNYDTFGCSDFTNVKENRVDLLQTKVTVNVFPYKLYLIGILYRFLNLWIKTTYRPLRVPWTIQVRLHHLHIQTWIFLSPLQWHSTPVVSFKHSPCTSSREPSTRLVPPEEVSMSGKVLWWYIPKSRLRAVGSPSAKNEYKNTYLITIY